MILEHEGRGADAGSYRLDLFFTIINPELMLIEQVMRRAPRHADDRMREDMHSQMVLYVEKIITRPASSIDLNALATKSPTELMLRLLHTIYPRFEAAAFRKFSSQHSTTFEQEFEHPSVPSVIDQIDESKRRLLDTGSIDLAEVGRMVHRLRGGARTELGARLLHETYDIPEIAVPLSRVARNSIIRHIGNHPAALRDSLLSHAFREAPADPDMSALWARFTPEQADELSERDDRVLLTVVTAALSPRPPVTSSEIKQLREVVSQGSRNEKWPALSRKLIRAWVAEFTGSPVAIGDTNVEDPKSADGWRRASDLVLQFPGRPLGSGVTSAASIDRRLESALRLIRQS
ncbi:hypothetical protein EDF62_3255 [Leucobacter luti]|uniref:Uncharacterized protein n=2 Tax=Leucobacter luti TaxID=340320 RepID=A0A4R6RS28_9MICO|nr:hypothetical protein EDF62_3255 [Leucobacter luti]